MSLLPRLTAFELVQPMEKGSKDPCHFACLNDAGQLVDVVLKFRERVHRREFSLVLEAVGGLLARDLGLECPEGFVVEIPSDLHRTTQPRFRHPWLVDLVARSAGANYGSRHLGGGWSLPLVTGRVRPQVRAAMWDILVFDLILQNSDRKADNPNLLQKGETIAVIDHEMAMEFLDRPEPVVPEPDDLRSDLLTGHVLLPAVDLAPDFDRVLCRLERLPETRVRAYFEALPKEWLDLRSTNLETYLLWLRGNRAALETRLKDLLP